MLEDVLFNQLTMSGELIRVIVALIGTGAAAYYDLFNKKNIPDNFLYLFLGISFLLNLVLYQEPLFWFSLAITIFFSAIGYLFYRVGQLGGADVFIIASISLLLPITPSFVGLPFNMPFILPLIIFSGAVFALYVMAYFGYKVFQGEAKPNLLFGLMLIPYLLFAYVYVNSILFSPVYFVLITILLFATIFFMMFRDSLQMELAEELPVTQLEPEDVIALEIMNKDLIERYKIPRLVSAADIERLKKTKVGEVWVYTRLPPFIPFLLAGMILSLFLAKSLIMI
jgi:hypothetical protein